MGWFFVISGAVLIAIGSILVYYGQDLIRQTRENAPHVASVPTPQVILSPPQEKLLRLLWEHQEKHAALKLVVSREGMIVTPRITKAPTENLLTALFSVKEGDLPRAKEFEVLMEELPDVYLRRLPETRVGSPFVVAVTEEGRKYLRRK